MSKTLVTGVAGFIGSHIAQKLVEMGFDVYGIDDLSAGYLENIPRGVKFIPEDVRDVFRYTHFLKDVDVVFHNAASKKNICLKNPVRDMEINGIGTLMLLQECIRKGVRKFVHASTGSVYGEVAGRITEETPRNPVSYYGISKTAGESYVWHHRDKINVTILRYFHVYGDRQEKNPDTGGVISIFTDQIKRGIPITVHGDGSQKRVFTYVSDIVHANIQSWINPTAKNKIYNCASGVRTEVIEAAGILMKHLKKEVKIRYADPLPGDIYNFDVDATRINELGVKFKSINEVYEVFSRGLLL